jgi:hypothetical protein
VVVADWLALRPTSTQRRFESRRFKKIYFSGRIHLPRDARLMQEYLGCGIENVLVLTAWLLLRKII